MPLVIDASDFVKKFEKLNLKWTGPVAKKALFNALATLKLDTEDRTPTTPKRKGDLRSRVRVKTKELKTQVNGSITWRSKYAKYQEIGRRKDGTHVVRNYSEPGSGKGYVSTKIEKFTTKYIRVISQTYRKSKI